MGNVYRSARGEVIDMDLLRLSNEEAIAIGNMRTNARGDELGAGGKVVKTRAQIMSEYHKLNTPVADDTPVAASKAALESTYVPQKPMKNMATPTAQDMPVVSSSSDKGNYVKPRGSLAGAVAEETEVNQELLEPSNTKNNEGIQRI